MGSVEEISEAVGHAFWDTQPVPSLNAEEEDACGPINPADPEKVRAEPYNLPPAFEWTDLDLSDAEQAKELYTLLHENYVEDGDAMFRFDYSLDFIRWAMQPPGALDYWHVGVRVSQTKKLVAFIGATPADLLCHGQRVEPRPPPAADKAEEGEGGAGASGVNMEEKLSGLDLDGGATGSAASSGGGAAELGDQAVVEVNFLCVHKKLRSKRLAPVLIREVTRRVNEKGIFQATYTAGVVLPRPVARCRYWHRSLNPKKLIEVGFSRLAPRMTMVRTLKLYALPDQPATKGVRALKEEDVPSCCAKLNAYLRRYKLTPQLSEAEFSHWLVPRKGVIYTYVVEEAGEDGEKEVTDMFSFYSLPSSVLKHEKHTKLHAAYCYYYFANKTPVQQLINDALVLAKRHEFDVFNALDILDNDSLLKELKFGIGDGHLQYYLYNWRCPTVVAREIGLVLL